MSTINNGTINGRGGESLKIASIRLFPRFYSNIGSVLGFFRFYQ